MEALGALLLVGACCGLPIVTALVASQAGKLLKGRQQRRLTEHQQMNIPPPDKWSRAPAVAREHDPAREV